MCQMDWSVPSSNDACHKLSSVLISSCSKFKVQVTSFMNT